jgi:peptidoglycan/LPS O-acetylase OafA/YrhL
VGVEEQFYLLWPHVIKRTKRFFLWVLVGLIIVKLTTQYAWPVYPGPQSMWLFILRSFQLEYLSLGGIGAYLVYTERKQVLGYIYHPLTQVAAAFLCLVFLLPYSRPLPRLPGLAVAAVFLVVLLNLACNPRRLLSLENRFYDFGGKLSYGTYVFHPLFIFLGWWLMTRAGLFKAGQVKPFSVLLLDAGTVLGTTAAAWLSYRFFETPFLRLKDRFAVVPSGAPVGPRTIAANQPGLEARARRDAA